MVRSGAVSQDGSDRERKMAYEERIARRERSGRRQRAVMGNLEGEPERERVRERERGEKSFEVIRGKKATMLNLKTKEFLSGRLKDEDQRGERHSRRYVSFKRDSEF